MLDRHAFIYAANAREMEFTVGNSIVHFAIRIPLKQAMKLYETRLIGRVLWSGGDVTRICL